MWPGRPELANPADVPDFSCRTDPGRRTVGGVGHVDCNYRLLVDNLMDLGHAQYVHPSASQSDAFNRAVRKVVVGANAIEARSEEHTSELQSLMRISYAVFCLKKNKKKTTHIQIQTQQYRQENTTNI